MTNDKNSFRFLNWQVYRDAKEVFYQIIGVANGLPREYRYELGSQLIRSSHSVILNIAEGSGKRSDKELNRYFGIALGSIYETIASLDVLRDNNLIAEEKFRRLFEGLQSLAKQLGGFKKLLSR